MEMIRAIKVEEINFETFIEAPTFFSLHISFLEIVLRVKRPLYKLNAWEM